MPDRRRSSRYVIAERPPGSLRVMEDVVIEWMSADEISVLAAIPIARGEEMVLQTHGGNGSSSVLVVRAVGRQAVVADGAVQHRVRLRIVSGTGDLA